MQIRNYDKVELATLYFPQVSQKAALGRLNRWIHRCPELLDKLQQENVSPRAHFFTRRQVQLIVDFLDDP